MITFLRSAWILQLMFCLAAGGTHVSAVEIIAHRGASADAPENTLSAMKLAWEQQADAIELDLWLSKDGKLVVFHDADTKRYDGKTRKVADLTWHEIRQLDVGAWKDPKFKDERIPTLESILETVPENRRAVLEIKCGPEIVPELSRVLRASGLAPQQFAIISFNFESVKESKRELPRIEHYFLHGYKKDPVTGELPKVESLIRRSQSANLDGLNLHFDWPITREFVQKVKGAGLKLFVWTVNDAAVARRMASAGVDGITTDRPEWLREQLRATTKANRPNVLFICVDDLKPVLGCYGDRTVKSPHYRPIGCARVDF